MSPTFRGASHTDEVWFRQQNEGGQNPKSGPKDRDATPIEEGILGQPRRLGGWDKWLLTSQDCFWLRLVGLLSIPGMSRTGVNVNPTCCQSTTRAMSALKIVPGGRALAQIKPQEMVPRLVTIQWEQLHQ